MSSFKNLINDIEDLEKYIDKLNKILSDCSSSSTDLPTIVINGSSDSDKPTVVVINSIEEMLKSKLERTTENLQKNKKNRILFNVCYW